MPRLVQRFSIAVVMLTATLAGAVGAQDRAAVVPGMTVLLKNERVRVQYDDVRVGETVPMHTHPAYVVYTLAAFRARIRFADGTQRISARDSGVAYWNAPVTHSVENLGTTPVHNLMVEVKPGPPCSTMVASSAAQGPGSTADVAHPMAAQDSIDIMNAIQGESAAFWTKDFDAWAGYWVHAPYARIMGWWKAGGITVQEGWDVIGSRMKQVMHDNPKPNPTASRLRRDKINLQVRGDVAWVTFDQYGLDTGDKRMDMPGLSRETRVLEKQGETWRIAYAGWLLQGP